MDNTKETKWHFCRFFVSDGFVCFFNLTSLLLTYYDFQFGVFMTFRGVCVSCAFLFLFFPSFPFLACLFSKEREKEGMRLDEWRGGKVVVGDGRGETDQNILHEKLFSIKITNV